MSIPATNWKNKAGTANRSCSCSTWKNHWMRCTKKSWPAKCSVQSCNNTATLGGHVFHPQVTGERIVPMCDSCNKLSGEFTLKGETSVPSANKAITCEKPA